MSILPKIYPVDDDYFDFNEAANKLLNNPLIAKDVWRTVDDLGLVFGSEPPDGLHLE